ncbi:MAG: LysR family transcriptional regulator [Parahaliea sp.]
MPSDVRLRYLFESAQLGTMRAASEKLDVATSSVSRQISELEQELGLALIEKGRRRIRLTEAGEAACQYYRDNLSQDEVFLSRLKEMNSIRTGNISLAVGVAFVTQPFSDLLVVFMERYPGMEVRVMGGNTIRVVERVREDEAHMGLIFDIPREPKVSVRLVIAQPLKVIVNRSHALSCRQRVGFHDIESESIALPEEGYRIRQFIHAAEHEDGAFLEASLETNSLALLVDFVKSGRGISILPELVVREELRLGTLRALDIDSAILNSTRTSLITRVGRQLPVGAYRLLLNLESFLKSSTELPQD